MMNTNEHPESAIPRPAPAEIPHNDRLFALGAYLSWLTGLWLVFPVFLFVWRGRRSPFLGFHAAQAGLFHIVSIPLVIIGLAVVGVPGEVIESLHESTAKAAMLGILALVGVVILVGPVVVILAIGLSAMNGRMRALPVIGRWARRIAGV